MNGTSSVSFTVPLNSSYAIAATRSVYWIARTSSRTSSPSPNDSQNLTGDLITQAPSLVSWRQRHPLPPSDWIALSIMLFTFILGVFGNIYVIYIFGYKKRRTRSRFELLLLLLGSADLLSSFFTPSLFAYGILTRYEQWDFGWLGCKIIPALLPLNVSISQGILVLISVERYRIVLNPLCPKMKSSILFCWILFMFTAAVIMVMPYSYSLDLVHRKDLNVDTCVPTGTKTEYALSFSLINLIRDFIATLSLSLMNRKMVQSLDLSILGQVPNFARVRQQMYAKMRKMLLIMVVLFSFCVIPVDMFQVGLYIGYFLGPPVTHSLYKAIAITNTFLSVLQASNSAINILVYSKMHQDFKRCLRCRHLRRARRQRRKGNSVELKRLNLRHSEAFTTMTEARRSQFHESTT